MEWLRKTGRGWVEPTPGPCKRCGSVRRIVGWHSCMCGGGPLNGGHRTWECGDCERAVVIGCADGGGDRSRGEGIAHQRPPSGVLGVTERFLV